MADDLSLDALRRLLLEERRQREEAERYREEAERHREEADRQREEAQRRITAAEEHARRDRERADAAEEHVRQERERRESAERQLRGTTLSEYIRGCHDFLYMQLAVETDKTLTTKGATTRPDSKMVPAWADVWPGFLKTQASLLGELYSAYSDEEMRAFESLSFLKGLGDRVAMRKITSEKDLEYAQHNIVETPVANIISRLVQSDKARSQLGLEGGISFENHAGNLWDALGDEKASKQPPSSQAPSSQAPSTERRTSERLAKKRLDEERRAAAPQSSAQPPPPFSEATSARPNLQQLRPDQFCVYRIEPSESGAPLRRQAIFVVEYKAPHKLTPPHFRIGLKPMDIYKDVVNRATIPTPEDEDEFFKYYAQRLVAAVLVQTYHYMIEGGLEYGYISTGEVLVFLKVDWNDPTKLYYHLAEPGPEVQARRGDDSAYHCTAISQILAFTLLSLRSRARPQDERHKAIVGGLKRWKTDFDLELLAIPKDERKKMRLSLGSRGFYANTYSSVDRSPFNLRGKPAHDKDSRPSQSSKPRSDSSSDSSSSGTPDSPLARRGRRGGQEQWGSAPGPSRGEHDGDKSQRSASRTNRANTGAGGQRREYCTQKCLLGLVRGTALDEKCPNISLHWPQGPRLAGARPRHHPISHAVWLDLLRKQLKQTLDDGIFPLGKQGARGALFQITLLAYGYTFVAKGTIPSFVRHLEHEAEIYQQRLRPLQGTCVPVFLGAIDLRNDLGRIYYYDFRVYIVHLMLLSWGGDAIDVPSRCWADVGPRRGQELLRSVHALHAQGVVHGDVRVPNALWNEETGRVVLVDFDRAELTPALPRPLVKAALKRMARHGRKAKNKMDVLSRQQVVMLQEDINMARVVAADIRDEQGRSE